jgi:hypothetical protein
MKDLLLEGGVGGHLMHLYDNPEMTFNKIAKILYKASSGELEGTEKTDGFNVYLGSKDGQARAARNKGDMSRGGMTMDDLVAREFKGGEKVRKAYLDSFDAFQAAINSLTPEEQGKIFGLDGEIFYNSEIMGPGASNLLNYDTNVITIHHGGHKMYDAENNKLVVVDTEENSRALDRVIDRFEQATAEKDFSVQRTAVMQLQALDNDSHVKVALERMRSAGFDGGMTIEDFLVEKIMPVIEDTFPHFADNVKQGIMDRLLNKKGISLTQITKGFPVDQKKQVSAFISGEQKKLLGNAIWPIEKAIHDFAVKLLESLKSAYILDNAREVERLKIEVEEAIKSIHSYEGEGQDAAMEVLYKQLQKLEHHDNITTPVEGFVFEYEGQLYKFTGNFAPVNQILGLFKYGRGSVPPIKKDAPASRDGLHEEDGEESGVAKLRPGRTIAIIPGAFKPPHRGHLDMVEHYSNIADEVKVFVSKLPRSEGDHEFTAQQSVSVWNVYLDAKDLGNVEIDASPHASPVTAAYQFVENDAPEGSSIILGASTKGGDESRFAKALGANAKEGVTVLDPMEYAFEPIGEVLSATDFRKALVNGKDIKKWLPHQDINGTDSLLVDPYEIQSVLGLEVVPNSSELRAPVEDPEQKYVREGKEGKMALPIFFRMIEELLYEQTEPFQIKVRTKHSKMKNRLVGKGGNKHTGGGKGHTKPSSKRAMSAPPMGENEEIEETSAMAVGHVEIGAGKKEKPPKRDTLIREDDLIEKITDYILNKAEI